MRTRIEVLDHGFIGIMYDDYRHGDTQPSVMGSDKSICDAARVSYQGGTKTISDDTALLRALMRRGHTSPFEMCEMKFICKMPIFVARQWVRHRTASINEVSARYSVLDSEFYFPEHEDIGIQTKEEKQGRGAWAERQIRDGYLGNLHDVCEVSYGCYDAFVKDDISRELARAVLPLNIYTQWIWKANLLNIFRFLSLRMDKHAQKEIRVYADAMAEIVSHFFPIAYVAFEDYWLNAVTFSAAEMRALRRVLKDPIVGLEIPDSFGSNEEKEFLEKLYG